MKLEQLPKHNISGVFSDLDSTLTDGPKLAPKTYEALWRLKEAGKWLVIVSGRPAGWADCLMRMWPIDAMIFENGAGVITRVDEKLKVHNLAATQDLKQQRATLQRIFEGLKQKIPHLKLASDQPYRLFDYAVDFKEEPPPLSEAEINAVLEALSKEKGITAKLSSIHVNYWCGTHTKVTACEHLLETEGKTRGIAKDQIVFSGDSPNDEPLFAYFPHSVGVANIGPYLDQLKDAPKYVTERHEGRGFQELVDHLLN